MSLQKQVLNNVFWSYVQQFGVQLVNFIVTLFLARIIGPDQIGLIGLLSVFIALGTALAEGGLVNSIIINETNKKSLSFIFFYNLFISIVIYVALYFFAPLIANFYNKAILTDIIRVYSSIIIINSLFLVHQTIYAKELKFKEIFIITFPSLIISGIISCILALNNFGIWSLVFFQLLNVTLNAILFWYNYKWFPTLHFKDGNIMKHFKFGSNLMFSNILDIIFKNSYALIIGKIFKISQVAFFNTANSLIMLPVSNVSGALNKVILPVFSKIKDDEIKFVEVYKKIQTMVIYIILPLIIIIFITSGDIIKFLYNDKWLPMISVMQILCITGLFYPLHYYNILVLQVKGRSDLFLLLEVVKKLIQVTTIIISINFGFEGLLWGSVLFSFLALFVNSYFAGKYINYSLQKQFIDLFPNLIIGSVLVIILIFVNQLINFNLPLLNIAFLSFFSVIIYVVLSIIFKISSFYELKKIVTNFSFKK